MEKGTKRSTLQEPVEYPCKKLAVMSVRQPGSRKAAVTPWIPEYILSVGGISGNHEGGWNNCGWFKLKTNIPDAKSKRLGNGDTAMSTEMDIWSAMGWNQ